MRFRPRLRITLLSAATLCGVCFAAWAAVSGQKSHESTARFTSQYIWSINAPWFGGFSGLEISADGQSFVTVTDRSTLITGRIERHGGKITQVTVTERARLTGPNGTDLRQNAGDSEGLAIAADDSILVSFESTPRVTRYVRKQVNASSTITAIDLPRLTAFDRFHTNKAFEAMAIDAHSSVYVMPESAPIGQKTLPIWRWDGEDWKIFDNFPTTKGFHPVGADFGPDGRLYVLERQFLAVGFRSRLSRFEITPDGLGPQEILLKTKLGTHDNLEGLAIWRDPVGALRATMISDDNFFFLQKTEFVEYQLPD